MLFKKNAKYIFFSGKGGVGKTTVAAATALKKSKQGETLIVSIDPAHSLSDSFEKQIGGEISEIGKNLFGIEIDPEKSVKQYQDKISGLEQLKGLGMDIDDLSLSTAPGIDEMAAFDRFMQYMNSDEYDFVIFDTAPTGHALRFLSLPDVMGSWIGKMIKWRMKFSEIFGIFKKILPFTKDEKDNSLEVLEKMKEKIREAREIMQSDKTEFNIVMIPEEMSIFESERAMKTLEEYGIPVKKIIVNQIFPENPKCGFCTAKRNQQMKRLKTIKEKFSKQKIIEIPLFKKEIKGTENLKKLENFLH